MREIKFRAYYQKVSDDSWIIEGEYTLKDLTDKGILFDQDRIKWVQFTGMADDKGVDVYENDIVKITGDEYYSNESFSTDDDWSFIGKVEQNSLMWLVFNSVWLPLCDVLNDELGIEIIGNTFSNPELLEEKLKC